MIQEGKNRKPHDESEFIISGQFVKRGQYFYLFINARDHHTHKHHQDNTQH